MSILGTYSDDESKNKSHTSDQKNPCRSIWSAQRDKFPDLFPVYGNTSIKVPQFQILNLPAILSDKIAEINLDECQR